MGKSKKSSFKETFPPEKTMVETQIEERRYAQERRGYVGASILGHPCSRYIWYTFRWWNPAGTITARQNRLFNRGHQEEPVMLKELKSIGVKVLSTQNHVVLAQGHISGHCDGILIKVPDAPKTEHIFEGKTAASTYFQTTKKTKDISLSDPGYYVQCIVYMYMFRIKRCLFIMTNKNNDDRYYERIKANTTLALEYLQKGVDIINAKFPPNRAFADRSYYRCGWCSHSDSCWDLFPPEKNCRTCKHSKPINKGQWQCQKRKEKIKRKLMLKGCGKYKQIL